MQALCLWLGKSELKSENYLKIIFLFIKIYIISPTAKIVENKKIKV